MIKKSKESIMMETEKLLAFDHAIITIYEEILSGKRKRFPLYTWELSNSMYYAEVLMRYVFEEKLRWSIEDIKEKFKFEIIKKMRLGGMFQILFSNAYDLIHLVYPNQIRTWEINRVLKNFWEPDDNKKEALKWLFEEKLQWDIEDIKEKANNSIFYQYGLGSFLAHCFNSSTYQAINFLYPGQIQPWELKGNVHHIWDKDEDKRKALRWLIDEKLKWDVEEIDKKMTARTFATYKLGGLIKEFNGSPYSAMKFLYPNEEFCNLKSKRKNPSKEESAG